MRWSCACNCRPVENINDITMCSLADNSASVLILSSKMLEMPGVLRYSSFFEEEEDLNRFVRNQGFDAAGAVPQFGFVSNLFLITRENNERVYTGG
jgi:hypothetical protein